VDSNNGRPQEETAVVETNSNTSSMAAGSDNSRTPTADQSDLLQILGEEALLSG